MCSVHGSVCAEVLFKTRATDSEVLCLCKCVCRGVPGHSHAV